MAIDRTQVRRRVRHITGWAACGAAALTAGAALGAARGSHAAKSTSSSKAAADSATPEAVPQQQVDPYGQGDQQGFAPPSASTGPPQGMSGGS